MFRRRSRNHREDERGARGQLLGALLALGTLCCVSSLVLMEIEGWAFWRALYFTLITITTVGYGDQGISPEGQKFATVLMIGGIGLTTYAFALTVQFTLLTRLAWRTRMQTRIDKLRDHVIVCGFGRMGVSICAQLASADATFVVIESDADGFHAAAEAGYLAIEGLAIEDEVLEQAQVRHARHIVASVGGSSDNIVIALSARALNPDIQVIARAERDDEERKLLRAGAQRVVRPYSSGGLEIANAILFPEAAGLLEQLVDLEQGLALAEVPIAEGSALAGVSLSDYGRDLGSQISFVARKREGKEIQINPRGSDEMLPGDILIVAGNREQISEMTRRGRAGA